MSDQQEKREAMQGLVGSASWKFVEEIIKDKREKLLTEPLPTSNNEIIALEAKSREKALILVDRIWDDLIHYGKEKKVVKKVNRMI